MYQFSNLQALLPLIPAQVPKDPVKLPPVKEDPEIVTARTKIRDLRDDALSALNYFATNGQEKVNLNRLADPALKTGPYRGGQGPTYRRQYDTRAETFDSFLRTFGQVVPVGPLAFDPRNPDQRPAQVYGAIDATAQDIATQRNSFITDRLSRFVKEARAVDSMLGEIGSHFRNQNANLGLERHSGGWRTDTGSTSFVMPDQRILHVKYDAGKKEYVYAVVAKGTDVTKIPANQYLSVRKNPPVVLIDKDKKADDPANRGSAGTSVQIVDPTTGKPRTVVLVVQMADPKKDITDPANRDALQASVLIDALRNGKSIRQAGFAVQATTSYLAMSEQLGKHFDRYREEWAVARTNEIRLENCVRTVLAAGGKPLPNADKPTHFEINGKLEGNANLAILVRQNPTSKRWEWASKAEPDKWTPVDEKDGFAKFAPGVTGEEAIAQRKRLVDVLTKLRDRQETPRSGLAKASTDVANEELAAVREMRLLAAKRILGSEHLGFKQEGDKEIWTVNTGECEAKVFRAKSGGFAWQFRLRTGDKWSNWSAEEPLPTTARAAVTGDDGQRNPGLAQFALIHNHLVKVSEATALNQTVLSIKEKFAGIDTLIENHRIKGNTGDPMRDILVGIYGAAPVAKEPYGPGVLEVTIDGTKLLMRRTSDATDRARVGWGLWEAALPPEGDKQPTWVRIAPAEVAKWRAALKLKENGSAEKVLKFCTHFSYSTGYDYQSPTQTHPIAYRVPNFVEEKDRIKIVGELGAELLTTQGKVLKDGSYTLLARDKIEVRFNDTGRGATNRWEVRYGSGDWIVCGQPKTYNTTSAAALRTLFLLSELNKAAATPPPKK